VKISLAFCEAKLQIFCLQTPSLFVRSPCTLPSARVPPETSSVKHCSDLPAPPDTGDPNVYRVVELHEVFMSLPPPSSSELWPRACLLATLPGLAPASERTNTVNASFSYLCRESKKDGEMEWRGAQISYAKEKTSILQAPARTTTSN
jgi:hypothetical protein